MTNYYVDTSALAKYYLSEVGTHWLRQLIRPSIGNFVVISHLTTVEMISLIQRKQRGSQMSPAVFLGIENKFLNHTRTRYVVSPVNYAILEQSRSVVKKHDLRSLDAIQLTCAMDSRTTLGQPLTFLSSDQDLLAAAQAEGFSVDDPNLHP